MTDDQTQAMNEIMASIRRAVVAPDEASEPPLVLDRSAAVEDDGDAAFDGETWPPVTSAAQAPVPTAGADAPLAPVEPVTAAPVAASPPAETSLEGLVRSILEPALKSWLDANLPEVVERITKAEIVRLTRP